MKRIVISISVFFLSSLLINSCKKINYFPDNEVLTDSTRVVAHRGGRTATVRENTLNGIRAALKYCDGVEVDVQISKNETIWLSHSEQVSGCNQSYKCFAETTDQDIEKIDSCNGQDIAYTKLEDVFSLMSDSFPEAFICIDLKGWIPCSANSLDIDGMMRRECEIIIDLAKKYNLLEKCLIETEGTTALIYAKKYEPKCKAYHVSHGEFERTMLLCLNYGFDGISYKLNVGENLDLDKINMLHRKGLRIIAWNQKEDQLNFLKSIKTDFIQKDY